MSLSYHNEDRPSAAELMAEEHEGEVVEAVKQTDEYQAMEERAGILEDMADEAAERGKHGWAARFRSEAERAYALLADMTSTSSDLYKETESEMADAELLATNPYAYYGVSPRDFI